MCRISFMRRAKKTQKGNKMNTLNENKRIEDRRDFPHISNHFVKRYFERILSKPVPKKFHRGIYNGVRKDMETRMLDREKLTLQLFAKASMAVVPIAKFYQIVLKNNTLITVY